MRKLFLCFLFAGVASVVSAQNVLEVLDHNDHIVTGKTVSAWSNDPAASLLESHLKVQNTGATALQVFVRRISVELAPNTMNSFCFGINCYGPSTDTSVFAVTIAPGAVENSFIGDYYPAGLGRSVITYEFFDNVTLAERVASSVTISYMVGTEIDLLDHDVVVNGQTLSVKGSNPNVDMMEKHIAFRNNTVDTLSLYLRRIQNSVAPGTMNSFCFGINCYGPTTDTSNFMLRLPPAGVDSILADYYPMGNGGLTSITYEVYDLTTFPAKVSNQVTVEFHISGVGMGETSLQDFTGPYPNPAVSSTAIEYSLPASAGIASLEVRNMQGVIVERSVLEGQAGKKVINVSSLAPGLYTCTVIAGNEVVYTKKLVVKR